MVTKQYILFGGLNPSENMKVSWEDEIPNIWKIKNVPNHQPVYMNYNHEL